MCEYCEERKPLFAEMKITNEKTIMKNAFIVGRKIVTCENAFRPKFYFKKTESDFDMDYCLKCGKGLSENTTDVQSIRESDKI